MSKIKSYLDSKYSKISFYVICTAVIIFFLCILISMSGGFFQKIFTVIGLVLKPIIAGGVIAYLFEPVLQWLEKRIKAKNPRLIALIITIVVLVLIILAILLGAVMFIGKTVNGINFEDINTLLTSFTDQIDDVKEYVQKWLTEHSINIGSVTGSIGSTISGITGAASDIFFAAIFAIYFLMDSNGISGYWNRVRNIFIKKETQAKVHEVLMDADKCFSGYIRGQFLDAILVGVVTLVAMVICGVPYPFVIALLTGLGNLIPYVGPVVGFVTLVIVCLIESAWTKLLIGAIVMAVLLFVDGNIINPKLLSSSIEIHPLLVFAAMIAGSAVGGLLGMLVAVPLMALAKLEFDKYIDRKEKDKAKVKG